jgi:hypothetical protein
MDWPGVLPMTIPRDQQAPAPLGAIREAPSTHQLERDLARMNGPAAARASL